MTTEGVGNFIKGIFALCCLLLVPISVVVVAAITLTILR
jgi:hypothetical protein